jgi:UDP:flavonoid glycosyltransferase YjiC (YdhE family)
MPYSHDQPDNAARCRRNGVARTIRRHRYNAASAATEIRELSKEQRYRTRARQAAAIVTSENGAVTACDAIENALLKAPQPIK